MNFLFQRLGGEPAIERVVAALYQRVLVDPTLTPFFASVDMAALHAHQRHFLSVAFGEDRRYEGRSLRDAHRDLVQRHGLDESHFDAVLTHLEAAMKEVGLAPVLVAETMAVVETKRRDVLGKMS
jgi:hemoglobin